MNTKNQFSLYSLFFAPVYRVLKAIVNVFISPYADEPRNSQKKIHGGIKSRLQHKAKYTPLNQFKPIYITHTNGLCLSYTVSRWSRRSFLNKAKQQGYNITPKGNNEYELS